MPPQPRDSSVCVLAMAHDATSSSNILAVAEGISASTGFASQLHPIAARLPPPAKTGDDVQDSDASARYMMFQELVSILIRDGTHIPDLFTRLRNRIDAQSKKDGISPADALKPFTHIKTLSVDYMFEVLVRNSDMSHADLVKARAADEDSTLALFTFLTQMPPHLKALPACQARPVMTRLVTKRTQQCGHRLRTFKKDGGIPANGTLNWRGKGAFSPVFDKDGWLIELKHVSGDTILVENQPVSNKFAMTDNHSDWLSAFIMKPLPPLKCHQFFKASASGPYRSPMLTSASKVWCELVRQSQAEWEAAQRLAAGAQCDGGKEAAAVVKAFEQKRRADKAVVAREAAAKAMAKKRARRSFCLNAATS